MKIKRNLYTTSLKLKTQRSDPAHRTLHCQAKKTKKQACPPNVCLLNWFVLFFSFWQKSTPKLHFFLIQFLQRLQAGFVFFHYFQTFLKFDTTSFSIPSCIQQSTMQNTPALVSSWLELASSRMRNNQAANVCHLSSNFLGNGFIYQWIHLSNVLFLSNLVLPWPSAAAFFLVIRYSYRNPCVTSPLWMSKLCLFLAAGRHHDTPHECTVICIFWNVIVILQISTPDLAVFSPLRQLFQAYQQSPWSESNGSSVWTV